MLNLSTLSGSNPLGPKVRDMSLRDRERLFFLMAQMLRAGQTAEGSLRAVARAFKSEKKDAISLFVFTLGFFLAIILTVFLLMYLIA